jgi:CHAT domain-containing protein
MKRFQLIIALFLVLQSTSAQSPLSFQQIDSLFFKAAEENNLKTAIYWLHYGKNEAIQRLGEKDTTYSNYCSSLGEYLRMANELDSALYWQKKALELRAATLGQNHKYYRESLFKLASVQIDMSAYVDAEKTLFEAKNLFEKNQETQTVDYGLTLMLLATIYEDTERFEEAELLYLEVLKIYKKILGKDELDYGLVTNNLGVLYYKMNSYALAEKYYLETKRIRAKYKNEEPTAYANILNNLAGVYQELERFDDAEKLLLEALEIRKMVLGPKSIPYAQSLNNLAGFYIETGKPQKALEGFNATLSIIQPILGDKHPVISNIYINLATAYQDLNQVDQVVKYAYKSLQANSNEITLVDKETDLSAYEYFSNFFFNRATEHLLAAVKKQYEQSQSADDAKYYYQLAGQVLKVNQNLLTSFNQEGDKLRGLGRHHALVGQAIDAALKLNDPSAERMAFEFAEQSKAVLLFQATQAAEAQSFVQLPENIRKKEAELQAKSAELRAALSSAFDQDTKRRLRKQLADLNVELTAFKSELAQKYPAYLNLKYNSAAVTVGQLQKSLKPKTALIEYVCSQEALYIFYISPETYKLEAVDLPLDDLNAKIKSYHRLLSNYEALNQETEKQKYLELAHELYNILLKDKIEEEVQSLIIIADGEIGHLPFESFLTQKQDVSLDFTALDYLLRDYEISYHFSAALWIQQKGKKQQHNAELFAVAANYDLELNDAIEEKLKKRTGERGLRDALQALPAARKEVESLQAAYQGFFAFDQQASEAVFKQKAKDYAIIHLAMHGLLNEKKPILSALAFTENGDSLENNFLQAYEITALDLNAELVVLSACETGYGRFEEGNGIASLARAFMYAGVPSLVVSLWQVNDMSTAIIMQQFYANLAKGMNKAKALQQAKISYLEASAQSNPIAAHPAFWAAFVQIGEDQPLTLKTKSKGLHFGYWIGIGAAFLLGSIFLFAQRRKRG